ncbi:hypothetical protein BCR42DRAFT_410874 [Absidia repens]|uniref:Uncharacterized protein n=1 Tax=Absidia repens TaxID=90262 RepID=A0A1X2IL01_9FUNG|nr:hypothetical protein BCR42DRAFT_410874 [Absidia repens]
MDHSDRTTKTSISASSISSSASNGTSSTQSNITTDPSNQLATASQNEPSTITNTAPSSNNANNQRQYPTVHSDKHLREFPLQQFDRNLTIEKATFEPPHQSHVPSPPQQQQQQAPRTVPSPQQKPHCNTVINAETFDNRESIPVDTSVTATASVTQSPSTSTSPAPSTVQQLPPQPYIQRGQYDTFMTSSPTKIPDKGLATTTKRHDAIPRSPPRTALASNKTKPSMKAEVEKQSNKKKNRKLPVVNGTATPSEVFHRNLVDAVSNVEDSDEHEQYVYPYSHHDPSTITSFNKNRSQQKKRNYSPTPLSYKRVNSPLVLSAPGSSLSLNQQQQHQQQQHQQQQYRSSPSYSQHNSSSSLLRYSTENQGQTYKRQQLLPQDHNYYRYGNKYQQLPLPQSSPLADEERGPWIKRDYHRPKLRSHVMDHNALPQPWAHEVSSSDDDDVDEADDDYNYHHSPEGERIYLLRHGQRQRPRSGVSCAKVLRNTCISIFMFIVMMMVFTVYRAEPLTDVSASMEHILASDKELIFDLMVRANNWNWWTARIKQADLSVFAFSKMVPFNTTFGVDPAEYLGSFQHFDQPLSFTSSAILGRHQQANASTQIRIKSPGADASGNQRWSRMIRYPFGLVTRGVLNYRPFPLFSLSSRQSISLCIVAHIDPNSSPSPSPSISVSYDDSDHGYCSHYPSVLPIL